MRRFLPSESSHAAGGGTVVALGAVAGLALWAAAKPRTAPAQRRADRRLGAFVADTRARAARRARQGSIMLAASAGTDSTAEHYRGGFHRRSMYLAPAAAAGALLASSTASRMPAEARGAALAAAFGIGIAGHYFHSRNVVNRPGGLSWLNLFYAAPIGAPGAVALAGLFGLAALALERRAVVAPRLEGRAMAIGTVAGLLGTTAEVGLLHFRGAFHNPAMLIPLTLPPAAALATAEAARAPTPFRLRLARALLDVTAAMGVIGVGFHAWGVHRNMGGWRNWSQNLQVAPPLPAPPGFTGVAIAGLGAIDLLEMSR